MTLHTNALSLLGCAAIATSTSAQSPDQPPDTTVQATAVGAQSSDERPDTAFRAAGGYLYQFESDFKDVPGSVSANRAYATFGSRFALTPTVDLGLRVSWEGGWYNFDGPSVLSLGTGADPWNTVMGAQFGGNLGIKLNEEWSLSLALFGGASGETGADAGDSLSIGGTAGATWRANDRFTIGGGVLVSSQIEDDVLIVPLLFIDWRITDSIRITNVAGPEAYPTGAGLELVCSAVENMEFAIGGRWESRRFRLDDSGPAVEGVGEDQGVGLWLRAGLKPIPQLRLDFLVGVMVGEEFTLSDRNGNELASSDLDPAPFVAGFVSWRF